MVGPTLRLRSDCPCPPIPSREFFPVGGTRACGDVPNIPLLRHNLGPAGVDGGVCDRAAGRLSRMIFGFQLQAAGQPHLSAPARMGADYSAFIHLIDGDLGGFGQIRLGGDP